MSSFDFKRRWRFDTGNRPASMDDLIDAKGLPSGSTVAALQAALDAAVASKEKVVLRPGRHVLDGPLYVPAGVTLAGEGPATVLEGRGSNAIVLNDGTVSNVRFEGWAPGVDLVGGSGDFGASVPLNNSTTGWNNAGGASLTLTRVAGGGYQGADALELVNSAGGEDDYAAHVIPCKASTTYTVTALQRIDSYTTGAIQSRSLFVAGQTASGAATLTSAADAGGGWMRRTLTITSGASDTILTIRLYAPQGTSRWSQVRAYEGNIAVDSADVLLGGRVKDLTFGTPALQARPLRSQVGALPRVAAKLRKTRVSTDPLKVRIFGDSLAEGSGSGTWPALLFDSNTTTTDYMVGTHFNYIPVYTDVVNWAVGSSTSRHLMAQLAVERELVDYGSSYINQNQTGPVISTPPVLNDCPDLAIIVCGQNGGTYSTELLEVAVRILRNAGVDVILVASNPSSTSRLHGEQRSREYRQIAARHQCMFADVNTAYRLELAKKDLNRGGYTVDELFSDTIHADPAGHKVYANTILGVLKDCVNYEQGAAFYVPPARNVFRPTSTPADVEWMNLPVAQFVLNTVGAVTRQAATNSVKNPRYGRADLASANYGEYVLPINASSWTDYLRFGVDEATAIDVIVAGTGNNTTLELATQNGGSSIATMSYWVTAGRIVTLELASFAQLGSTGSNKQFSLRCTAGDPARILGIVVHERGKRVIRPVNGTFPVGQPKFTGTWTTVTYRSGNGTGLPGTDTNGDSIEFDVNGPGAYALLGHGNASGLVDVFIDGRFVRQVDTYSGVTEPGYIRIAEGGLARGRHRMRLVLNGANASAVASPGANNSRRMVVAQVGTWFGRTDDLRIAEL